MCQCCYYGFHRFRMELVACLDGSDRDTSHYTVLTVIALNQKKKKTMYETIHKHTPQQSILGVLDSPSQNELLLPVHELLAKTMATTLETPSNVRTLNKASRKYQ